MVVLVPGLLGQKQSARNCNVAEFFSFILDFLLNVAIIKAYLSTTRSKVLSKTDYKLRAHHLLQPLSDL